MSVQKIAAFSVDGQGGNPAGVWIGDTLPPATRMQHIAREVGFSETAFAAPANGRWQVRYFSPESEVPFCGHATIALGAALGKEFGTGRFDLDIPAGAISVAAETEGDRLRAALQSPPTAHTPVPADLAADALALFGWQADRLDPGFSPMRIGAGASHLLIVLKDRATLSSMAYDLAAGRAFMVQHGFVPVTLVWREDETRFHVRNPFASGGVYEDPATGAAAAAFAGYLRDSGLFPDGGAIEIVQGEDMGMRSHILAEFTAEKGASVRVSGQARLMAG